MEFDIIKFLEELRKQNDAIWKELFEYKSDVEITCKVVFKNISTMNVYEPSTQEQLNKAVEELKANMSGIPAAKTDVIVKIKDKAPKKAKKKCEVNDEK